MTISTSFAGVSGVKIEIDADNLKSTFLDTDLSSVSSSDDTIASAKAIKSYIDSSGNTFVSSAAFNSSTGVLTLTKSDSSTVTVDLDGKYQNALTFGISDTNIPIFTSSVVDNDFLRVDGTSIEGRSAAEVLLDIGAQESLTFGISDTNIPIFTSGVVDNDFLRVDGTSIEGRSAAEVLLDIGAQESLTFGISDTNSVKIDSSTVEDDQYAKFTSNGLEGRTTAELLSDIGITASTTELNYVDGVTSSIQTQLNNKVSSQWTTSGNNIYYNLFDANGYVGIGTSSPTTKLHVVDKLFTTSNRPMGLFRVANNSDYSDFSEIEFGQVSRGQMYIQVEDENNTKGTLNLQPYGGKVATGIPSQEALSLDVHGGTYTTGYRAVASFRVSNNSSYNDHSRILAGQVSVNQMFLQVNNENNVKGTLLLQPYGGRVAIGTTSSTNFPLDVHGTNASTFTDTLYMYNHGNVTSFSGYGYIWTNNYTNCARFHNGVVVRRLYIMSDERIKRSIMNLNDSEALEALRLFEPKKYKYKDISQTGSNNEESFLFGFIAQQIKEVIPDAISIDKNYIPDINVFAEVQMSSKEKESSILVLGKSHNLTKGDIIKCIDCNINDIVGLNVIEIINDKTIKIDKAITEDQTNANNCIFVYGKEISDFHSLNKDAIWTIATAALQEVDRQLQTAKNEIEILKERLTALEAA
tara:strand:+ start:1178 stop:3259 length:2082 start_codon:yes stop_codon:yes gene_type:complete